MDKHSPTPWQARYNDTVADATGAKVAACWRPANAALIVEAVNNMTALKVTSEAYERTADGFFADFQKAEAERDRLRETLQRANRYGQQADEENAKLRDLVRRLADIVRHECNDYCIALTREAYAAIGEEVPDD